MNFATFHNRQPGCTTHAWYAPRDFPPPHPMMWLHKAQQQQQQQKQNNGREEDNGREEQKTRLDSGLRVARSFGRCVARAAALVAACRRPCDGDGPFGCTERHVWTWIARPIFRLWLPTPDTTTPRSLSPVSDDAKCAHIDRWHTTIGGKTSKAHTVASALSRGCTTTDFTLLQPGAARRC